MRRVATTENNYKLELQQVICNSVWSPCLHGWSTLHSKQQPNTNLHSFRETFVVTGHSLCSSVHSFLGHEGYMQGQSFSLCTRQQVALFTVMPAVTMATIITLSFVAAVREGWIYSDLLKNWAEWGQDGEYNHNLILFINLR